MRIGFKTSPQGVEWSMLDATWALAGSLDVFESAWMNDHLSDVSNDRHGPSFEALTAIATLAHHVPGRWLGHAVLANTFRHPGVLAKAATVLDHATGGRFILGLGAGWHLGEHESLGIPLPAIGERIDRFESAVAVIRALFSDEAARPPGVTRPDRFYPLERATNEPPPVRAGGPPIYLGGQRPRGIRLAARAADGWLLPGVNAGDSAYLSARREELLRALESAGRPAEDFAIVGQVNVGRSAQDRRRAVEEALELVRVGATELIVGIAASRGPDELAVVGREVGAPLREALG